LGSTRPRLTNKSRSCSSPPLGCTQLIQPSHWRVVSRPPPPPARTVAANPAETLNAPFPFFFPAWDSVGVDVLLNDYGSCYFSMSAGFFFPFFFPFFFFFFFFFCFFFFFFFYFFPVFFFLFISLPSCIKKKFKYSLNGRLHITDNHWYGPLFWLSGLKEKENNFISCTKGVGKQKHRGKAFPSF